MDDINDGNGFNPFEIFNQFTNMTAICVGRIGAFSRKIEQLFMICIHNNLLFICVLKGLDSWSCFIIIVTSYDVDLGINK